MANHVARFIEKCMVRKCATHSTLKFVDMLWISKRRYTSALFISNVNGKEYYSFIQPYIDFDKRLTDIERLQQDLVARKLNFGAKDVKSMWDFYNSVHTNKSKLEQRSQEISNKLVPLFEKQESLTAEEQAEFTKLKLQISAVKHDLRMIKDALENLKQSILQKMFELPNELDGRTPVQGPVVLKRVNSLNERSHPDKKNHIEIGRHLGLLEYRNPMQYYLCNDAALFELGILSYAGKILGADNMIRVAGADFSRSLIIDGSGLNHEDPADAFIIDNFSEVDKDSPNRMHLVGGASLFSFLAMHAKQLIDPRHFPIAYFSTGRQYTPFRAGSTPIGLFTVCQASAALAFILVKDGKSKEYHTQFERLLNTVCKLYDNVCDHYQIVLRSSSELRPWESMRVSFELWSPFSRQYIEVGHISVYGEYFSKRLQIMYRSVDGSSFPSVISGTVLSVPRLLGCLLEQNPDKFVIPQKILEHMPADNTCF
ncbi:serine--tRNA synthetase-like protein Slimp [Bombus pyrosoma]|uniref:serine--tRNA synthetase-like protein Slimp n=1 Tax=Bombus pyrosoma TaxID=396416 RepID=UPI001CB8F6C3|nr:serine--tRNA synthetase-like protein Slimp [Bombus pyrosoma]